MGRELVQKYWKFAHDYGGFFLNWKDIFLLLFIEESTKHILIWNYHPKKMTYEL
jgi:hypothetical protein